MTALEGLMVVTALAAVGWGLVGALAARRLGVLSAPDASGDDASGDDADAHPSVTIIAAARDEARDIESAVASWLAQDIAALQVIVVNDRSQDDTGAILDRLAEREPRLQVLHVQERPDGWLGKCHAQHLAAGRATGDWLLFTDADVRLAPGALRVTLAHAERESADVLALVPHAETDGIVQWAMTHLFFQAFLVVLGGAHANRDDGRCSLGVGAFNLVRRTAYESVGGHEEIRLQVGDDVALARLLVRNGHRHRAAVGLELARVHWQRGGPLATLRGLEKNAFWSLRFSLPFVAVHALACVLALTPLLAPFVGTPLAHAALGAWVAGALLPWLAWRHRWHEVAAGVLLQPLSGLFLVAACWNSAVRTLWRGGIDWRGDFFSLAELRAGLKPWSWWVGPVASRPPATSHGP